MLTFRRRRRTDIRKCALVAAALSVACVAALEFAGSTLTAAHSGLGGRLAPQTEATAPAGAAPAPTLFR
jgi:hypothetical protein